MRVQDLDTPAVVVDLDILKANISGMADYARNRKLRLRPHTKTHKIPEIAKMQLAAGAAGVTVAKTGEAEVMIDAGIEDILIAYPVVGAAKAERVAKLARRARLSVATDSLESATDLSRALSAAGVRIRVLVDIDVGFHRTGVQSPADAADLAAKVAALPGLEFAGLFCYPGQVREPADKQAAPMTAVQEVLAEAVERVKARGLAVGTVSSGSTPTARQTHLTPAVNETRPGTYVFNDLGYHSLGANRLDQCALTVHATVVSTARPGQVLLDAGTKTLTSDKCPAKFEGYGLIREYPDAVIERCNEEHGWVNVTRCAKAPKIGERVTIIPNHVCPVVNLHDVVYGAQGGRVEVTWTVAARGKVR